MTGDIVLYVSLQYTGPKLYITAENNLWSTRILTQDLNTLKFPLPKTDNITWIAPGSFEFFWPSTINSILHKHLFQRIQMQSSGDYQLLLAKLSVQKITLQIKQLANDVPTPSLKRPYPFTQVQYQYPQLVPYPQQVQNSQPSQTLPQDHDPTSNSLISNAPSSPNEVNEILLPSKILKIEPVPVAFPDWREDSIASSVPSARNRTPPQTAVPPIDNPKLATPPPALPLAIPPVQEMNAADSPPFPPRKRISRFSRWESPKPIPAPIPPSISRLPSSSSSDISMIKRLTRELWDVRRQITAGIAREAALVGELRALNAGPAIEASNGGAVSQIKLRAMERELAEEQRKRIEAEKALQDVERERKEPFVVPALLQAFIMISKLTTQALKDG